MFPRASDCHIASIPLPMAVMAGNAAHYLRAEIPGEESCPPSCGPSSAMARVTRSRSVEGVLTDERFDEFSCPGKRFH